MEGRSNTREGGILCDELMSEMCQALDDFEADKTISCIILTGNVNHLQVRFV